MLASSGGLDDPGVYPTGDAKSHKTERDNPLNFFTIISPDGENSYQRDPTPFRQFFRQTWQFLLISEQTATPGGAE